MSTPPPPDDGGLNDILNERLRDAFTRAVPDLDADAIGRIEAQPTTNPEFGDYQCNAAMALGKRLRRPPREVAQDAIRACAPSDAIESLSIAGPGFVNLRLRDEWLARHLERTAGDGTMRLPQTGRGRTVILDYSSPNVAKPMHIGHIRSTNIGAALDRMHRALGYRVIADNHIGDWGTQFGILITGYRHFRDEARLAAEPIDELERLYVKSYEQSQADPDWLAQCRRELVKLQEGDPENRRLWGAFVDLSLREFQRVYDRLGVSFDLTRGESHYHDRLRATVDRLTEAGLARESEGALVVFLEDEKLPPCIVRKSDGGYNYATTDLATVASRVGEFAPDRIVYVTDERQQDHFRQIFAICRRLGYTTDLEHVWFGLMRLPTGTFSTRQGNVIRLEKLLDEAEARAYRIVSESSPHLDEARRREIARCVGIGAVKYADLSQNPQTAVTFTWEKAMALDGNSAPYLQYAYARIASVRDKYAERFPDGKPEAFPLAFTEPIERALAVRLARFPDTVTRATGSFKPSLIADALYDLAQAYSSFYQNVPFLKADEGVRESRVRLCGMVATTLQTGLRLLGIETPERI